MKGKEMKGKGKENVRKGKGKKKMQGKEKELQKESYLCFCLECLSVCLQASTASDSPAFRKHFSIFISRHCDLDRLHLLH